ncbi:MULTISPECIES: hypothetical protein [Nitrosomonas]|uniref:Uncharacterized protein n=1 Tax=Nitrosomonas communis TaxID=44574 RepID=A0A0F7KGV4_9PROT|nr:MULTISPECIES: hypothetical protein [Nitrosomonas]AKH38308.1 hypothetical protein AAW31_11715 [Nitrosomonas communis]UVS60306.1 hypothetical protein NX761_12390 [Nitrosomonas sp. PLL12]
MIILKWLSYISSYAEWSDYCRQSLLCLGLPDPAACIFEYINDDSDRELLGDFLQAWHNKLSPILQASGMESLTVDI